MTRTEITSRLAVEHLLCPHCGATPGQPCKIMKRDGGVVSNILAGIPRAVPHQVRRAPFIEAWVDGYFAAEEDSIQAHR